MIEVPEDHTGPMYCSFECAAYDGYYSMKLENPGTQS